MFNSLWQGHTAMPLARNMHRNEDKENDVLKNLNRISTRAHNKYMQHI
jgi:hypothetical protein